MFLRFKKWEGCGLLDCTRAVLRLLTFPLSCHLCRTSTANFRSQWALPGFNCQLPGSVRSRTSTASSRCQRALPDLHRHIDCQKMCQIEGQKICQRECQKRCQIECEIERVLSAYVYIYIQYLFLCLVTDRLHACTFAFEYLASQTEKYATCRIGYSCQPFS